MTPKIAATRKSARPLSAGGSELGDRAGVVGEAAIVTDELFKPSRLTQCVESARRTADMWWRLTTDAA